MAELKVRFTMATFTKTPEEIARDKEAFDRLNAISKKWSGKDWYKK